MNWDGIGLAHHQDTSSDFPFSWCHTGETMVEGVLLMLLMGVICGWIAVTVGPRFAEWERQFRNKWGNDGDMMIQVIMRRIRGR
jgi:hypothetical protein